MRLLPMIVACSKRSSHCVSNTIAKDASTQLWLSHINAILKINSDDPDLFKVMITKSPRSFPR